MKYKTTEYNLNQYKDSKNLNSRIQIYSFNTSRENWYEWIFSHIPLNKDMRVLELASGNGNLWKRNADKIDSSTEFTFSDLNPGMIKDCEDNLKHLKVSKRFEVIDIEEIPYGDVTFDIVIANHALYHVPNLNKGLNEIRRVVVLLLLRLG